MSSVATSIEDVRDRFPDLPFMRFPQAQFLERFIREQNVSDVLELGFYHGRGTSYVASILEALGRGHITAMDKASARTLEPTAEQVVDALGLSHRCTFVVEHRSFTWGLAKMLEQSPRPQFDLVYIDGAHTWDGTGFSFLLADLMLRPGGWMIFDDMDWSIARSELRRAKSAKYYPDYGQEERDAKQVRKVWEILVPARGYLERTEYPELGWGVARKPGG